MKKLYHIEKLLFYSLVAFLPTQLGKHFWPDFSYVSGIRIDYLSPTVYFTDILIAGLFILWGIRTGSNGQIVKWLKKAIRPYSHIAITGILLLFILLNISQSDRIFSGLYSTLKLVEMAFVGYYTAKFVVSKNVFEKVVYIFSASVIFQSVLAIIQFMRQGSVGGMLYFIGERSFTASTPGIANASLGGELVLRPYGSLPHPNVLAGYLLVGMIMVLFSISSRKTKKELRIMNPHFAKASRGKQELWKKKNLIHNSLFIIRIVTLLVGSIALLLTMSRVPILLWIVTVLYYCITRLKNKLYPVIVLIACSLIFLTPIGARFVGGSVWDESFARRAELADAAFKMIGGNTLFGIGLSNFIPVLAQSEKPLTASTYLQPVHNIFLLVAAETGIIGLGLLLWFLWKTFVRIKNHELKSKDPLLVIFYTILITGLFDHYWLTLQQGQLLVALVTGISWAKLKK